MNLLTRNDPAKGSWLTILLYQNRMVFDHLYDFPEDGKDHFVQSVPMGVWKTGKNGCISGTVISNTDK
jgi:hypothetical protein